MPVYTFEVKGKPIYSTDEVAPGKAMAEANKHFGSLPQGAWLNSPWSARYFYWTEGNFFD
jgi:hypothetical protein